MKIKVLLLLTVFCILLGGCKKEETVVETTKITRMPNVNNFTVIDDELGEISVVDGEVYIEGNTIKVGNLSPSVTNPTLSIIEDCIYVHGEKGLERYNVTTAKFDPLYYDTMQFSFAGLNAIYYINDSNLYSAFSLQNNELVASQVTRGAYLLHSNTFYFISQDSLQALNLLTDTVVQLEEVLSPVNGLHATDTSIIVETVEGSLEVPIPQNET